MSSSISYTRQFFFHKDWKDFIDSVQAGGANGINIRMHKIEEEFDALSEVVSAINAVLQAPPVPKPQTLTLPPVLISNLPFPWAQQLGFVLTPAVGIDSLASQASGFMPINLPNGATIQSLRVTGSHAGGGVLEVFLYRQLLTGGAQDPVLQVSDTFPAGSPRAAFDIPPAPQNANVVVDNTTHKYFIVANLTGGDSSLLTGGTRLDAFQVTYSAL